MKHYRDSQNNIYAYEADGSQDHLIPRNYIRINDVEIKKIRDDAIAAGLASQTYVQKRGMEYPSIVDQLDMIYHEGIDSWKQKIKSIKDKYPKV